MGGRRIQATCIPDEVEPFDASDRASTPVVSSGRGEGEEMFTSAFPILSTSDLKRALGFYVGLLGGVVSYRFPPEGDPVYVGLDIGSSSQVGLSLDREVHESVGDQRISLWVYADDCDAAMEGLTAAGVRVLEEPTDRPWGERVARVLDPDGNAVLIGSRAGHPEAERGAP
jgi:lactoylglutathione lyase